MSINRREETHFHPFTLVPPLYNGSQIPTARIAERDGVVLYSHAVNSITAWADVGDDTWLATRMGIKRVSIKSDTPPRHYTLWDGLPGFYASALVADERGVYAIIELGTQSALCTLDTATDTWQTLTYLQKSYDHSFSSQLQTLLALDKDVVLATSGLANKASAFESVLLCLDRERHEPVPIPWDSAVVHAEPENIAIHFLACQNNRVTLGTSIGWLELPISPEGGPWLRRLTDKYIQHGVVGGGNLYLWLSQRRPGSDAYYQPDIALVDQETWQLTPIPPAFFPSTSNPSAVDEKGELWQITHINVGESSLFHRPDHLALKRWSLAESRWIELTDEGDTPGPPPNTAAVLLNELPPLAPENLVPDAPARLLTIDRGGMGRGGMGPHHRALRWLIGRFPHWLSSDASEELWPVFRSRSRCYSPALIDPGAPEYAWIGEPGALVRVATALLPAPPMRPDGTRNALDIHWEPGDLALDRVTLPETSVQLDIPLTYLLMLPDERFFALGSQAWIISKDSKHWQELPELGKFRHRPYAFLIKNKTAILIYSIDNPTLQCMDLESAQVISTTISPPPHPFLGADEQGAWWQVGSTPLELQVLEPDSSQIKQITPSVPDDFLPSIALGLSGGWLWWMCYQEGRPVLQGWSPKEDILSPTLVLEYRSRTLRYPKTAPISDGKGGFYMAVYGTELYYWENGTKDWSHQLSLDEVFLHLLALDTNAFYLADSTALICIQRETKTSDKYPFPCQCSADPERLYATSEAIFLMAESGLYRFDREKRTWERLPIAMAASPLTPQVLAASTRDIWGSLTLNRGESATLFRLEPITRQLYLFDEQSGLTGIHSPRVIMNKEEPWVLCEQGAFRFDSTAQRFVHEIEIPVLSIAPSASGNDVWLVGRPSPEVSHLYRWQRENQKTVLVTDFSWSHCFDVLCYEESTIIATDQGLYRLNSGGSWIPLDSAGFRPTLLLRGEDNSLWACAYFGLLRLQARK